MPTTTRPPRRGRPPGTLKVPILSDPRQRQAVDRWLTQIERLAKRIAHEHDWQETAEARLGQLKAWEDAAGSVGIGSPTSLRAQGQAWIAWQHEVVAWIRRAPGPPTGIGDRALTGRGRTDELL